jgi:transglutaminase-like putative cysteine protease
MKLRIRAELAYRFDPPTDAILKIQAARFPGQTILSERLTISPHGELREDVDPVNGERVLRGQLRDQATILYEAEVDNGVLQGLPADAVERPWSELPPEALPYLWPSRYCPSDQFGRFVQREFDGLRGGARVLAILDWISRHIDYVGGVSDAETTAARTFIDRAGVCRDFTHLGVSFCRASGIPARAVSAYAHLLKPPDFHAVFEVYLSGGWWLVDPTGLAPVEGLVRIATGRDAADIAFLSTAGFCSLVRQSVVVEEG